MSLLERLAPTDRRKTLRLRLQPHAPRLPAALHRGARRVRPERVVNWRRLLALTYNMGAWAAIIALVRWALPRHH